MDSEMMSSAAGKVPPFIPPSSPPPIDSVASDKDFIDDYEGIDYPDEIYDITGLSQKLESQCVSNAVNRLSAATCQNAAAKSLNEHLVNEENPNGVNLPFNNESKYFTAFSPPPLHCIHASGNVSSDDILSNDSPSDSEDLDINIKSSDFSRTSEILNEKPNNAKDNYSEVDDTSDISNDFGDFKCVNDDEFGDFECMEPIETSINTSIDNTLQTLNQNISVNSFKCDEAVSVNECGDDEFGDFSTSNINYNQTELPNEPYSSNEISDSSIKCNNDLNDSSSNSLSTNRLTEDIHDSSLNFDNEVDNNDDFGEFTANDAPIPSTNLEKEDKILSHTDSFNSDDDFGNFSSTLEPKKFNLEFSDEEDSGDKQFDTNSISSHQSFQKEAQTESDKSLNNFKSILHRWMGPLCENSGTEIESNIDGLNITNDALIWTGLEDLESSIALKLSWQNSHMNKLYMSALQVDARNILYANKWNSNVPLFAQTLSFSPLTPAKPSSCNETKKNLSATTPKEGVSLKKKENSKKSVITNEVDLSTEKSSPGHQKIIPPVEFDWNSSGLTNPLDNPAAFSSLLAYEILLNSSNISTQNVPYGFTGGESRRDSNSTQCTPKPARSPILEKIMKENRSGVTRTTTDLDSLPPDVREVVQKIPDLNFMRSKVLMFPILDK